MSLKDLAERLELLTDELEEMNKIEFESRGIEAIFGVSMSTHKRVSIQRKEDIKKEIESICKQIENML